MEIVLEMRCVETRLFDLFASVHRPGFKNVLNRAKAYVIYAETLGDTGELQM